MLCNVCKQIIKINDKNHICSFAQQIPISTPIARSIFQSFNDDFLSDTHETESLEVVEECKEPEHEDDDLEMLSTLISAIRQRHPLWDHRLPLTARFEPIKKLLWNEIYVKLNGEYSIDILKKEMEIFKGKIYQRK